MQEKKKAIIRLLELADDRELDIIYQFVLHLLQVRTE